MADSSLPVPDHTAVRVALWRALHVQLDSPPHVLDDEVGLRLIAPEERAGLEAAARGAASSGTPFISFFVPDQILALARQAGFKDVAHVSAAQLTERYFTGRSDGLRPSSGEELLVATT